MTKIAGPNKDESVSVEVREIDNGFIVRRSRYSAGSYESSETFSKERPQLEVEPSESTPPERAAGNDAMSRAKKAFTR